MPINVKAAISRALISFTLLTTSAGASYAQRVDDTALPVAPISSVTRFGLTNVFVLANPQMEISIIPAIGRIAAIQYGADTNALRMDESLVRSAARPAKRGDWRNFGGDWIWPVAQARWTDHFGRNWPPPELIDDRPWSAHAWRNADGSQSCLMTLDIEAPLQIRVSRHIQLAAHAPSLTIRQRIERTAPSDIPVTLWNISQIAGVDRVILPTDPDSRFKGGMAILDFAPPPDEIVSRCESSIVLHVRSGAEHKVGSDSPRGWIAAQRGSLLLIEQASDRETTGAYPDGGCRVEMYSNSGLGYTEIETLSVEKNLQPGERISNILRITCHRVAPDLPPCDLARAVRAALGEITPAP